MLLISPVRELHPIHSYRAGLRLFRPPQIYGKGIDNGTRQEKEF